MPLHILKLCVGVDTVEELADWQKKRRAQQRKAGQKPVTRHVTKMTPKRADDVLDGGSLYWVIKGVIRVRQRIIAIPGRRASGAADAPRDLGSLGKGAINMPPRMAEELRSLGLL